MCHPFAARLLDQSSQPATESLVTVHALGSWGRFRPSGPPRRTTVAGLNSATPAATNPAGRRDVPFDGPGDAGSPILRQDRQAKSAPLAAPPLIVRRLAEAEALDRATSSKGAGGAEHDGVGSGAGAGGGRAVAA